MSWSVSLLGTADRIAETLETYGVNMLGQSKVEYEAAKPHLIGLVKQNFVSQGQATLLDLEASGSGSVDAEGHVTTRSCTVKMTPQYKKLV
jgi:hypothetical protein